VFLGMGWLFDIEAPAIGYLTVFPALLLAGLMLGALGLLLSSFIRQLENFAGVMNFIIFPMFFASSALYPLWRMRESSLLLYQVSAANPFTHAVELIRFALYGQVEPMALAYTCLWTIGFLVVAMYGYNPARGFMARTGKGS
jgi:ABC-2 type transport system permease protein